MSSAFVAREVAFKADLDTDLAGWSAVSVEWKILIPLDNVMAAKQIPCAKMLGNCESWIDVFSLLTVSPFGNISPFPKDGERSLLGSLQDIRLQREICLVFTLSGSCNMETITTDRYDLLWILGVAVITVPLQAILAI